MGKKRRWWKKHQKQEKPVVAQQVQSVVPSKPCHDGIIPVFKVDRVTFWAGKAWDIMDYNDWSLMILLTDKSSTWECNEPSPTVVACEAARKLLSPQTLVQRAHAPFIGLDWEDFGVPSFGKDWWSGLLADILAIKGDEVNVAMGCTGGHGRTGTCMSILRGLTQRSEICPVTTIRKAYCRRAVESQRQLDYVEKITGKVVLAQPSWTRNMGKGAYTGVDSRFSNSGYAAAYEEQLALEKAQDERDLKNIIEKEIERSLGVPTTPSEPGCYKPILNKAGDIVGWEKDVAI